MVGPRQTIYFVIFSLLVLLLPSRRLHAEPMRVTENLRRETVLLPPSTPDKGQLMLVSFARIISEEQILGAMAMYDDPQTKRPVDYMELYDVSGGLLFISWIDGFGIRRTAMDRGLLERGGSKLEGALVLLVEGTPS
jgi:hypothetical protein